MDIGVLQLQPHKNIHSSLITQPRTGKTVNCACGPCNHEQNDVAFTRRVRTGCHAIELNRKTTISDDIFITLMYFRIYFF